MKSIQKYLGLAKAVGLIILPVIVLGIMATLLRFHHDSLLASSGYASAETVNTHTESLPPDPCSDTKN
jgi:hypothetical protein